MFPIQEVSKKSNLFRVSVYLIHLLIMTFKIEWMTFHRDQLYDVSVISISSNHSFLNIDANCMIFSIN